MRRANGLSPASERAERLPNRGEAEMTEKERMRLAYEAAVYLALCDTVPGFAKAYERRRKRIGESKAFAEITADVPEAVREAIGFKFKT
jgi:hypothetical protein